ncbi:unnamed protein product [Vitrella brassicaformis CCMP3155]|uniref:Uncharacterized protein n=1 Tax=Vitrella brassicaformis (strain CCMP3155) TaxID=1169540 RepID=A0A0G4EHM6_VITBC|nr:unnamed protein product [Vitrella brassicaformis CCMP3155]|eukprot:CEL95992.1 unnamed protein product [Vitrella brassicaformis CCMP3155]
MWQESRSGFLGRFERMQNIRQAEYQLCEECACHLSTMDGHPAYRSVKCTSWSVMWPAVIADSIGRGSIADAMKVLDLPPPSVTAFWASAAQFFDVYSFQHGQRVLLSSIGLFGAVPIHPMNRQSVFRDMTIERPAAIDAIEGPARDKYLQAREAFDKHLFEVRCPLGCWEFIEKTWVHPLGQVWHLVDRSYSGKHTIVTDGFRTDWLSSDIDPRFFSWTVTPCLVWDRKLGLAYCSCHEHPNMREVGKRFFFHVPRNPFMPGIVTPTDADRLARVVAQPHYFKSRRVGPNFWRYGADSIVEILVSMLWKGPC